MFDCHVDVDNTQTLPQAWTFLQSIVLYKSYYYYYLKLQNDACASKLCKHQWIICEDYLNSKASEGMFISCLVRTPCETDVD